VKHLLLTNDFPPKVGGIQSYLWELWRRLDPDSFAVLTASSHPDAAAFDAERRAEGIRIERAASRVLLPTSKVRRLAERTATDLGCGLVVLDPALPLGLVGPRTTLPYAVVLHGAEVTVPSRLPVAREVLASVLKGARLVVCAGRYPASEAARAAGAGLGAVVEVPPGVDGERFRALSPAERSKARASFGMSEAALVVLCVSRLVPRKGVDVLIEAAAALRPGFPELVVVVGGTGRDRGRLERLAHRLRSPVRFLGFVHEAVLPSLYGASDVFVMACRDRWAGLEQEGFGIVFLEAAAAGVPQVAGRSGGADEAVVDGETGFVLEDPRDPSALAARLRRLLSDEDLRRRMGQAARRRAEGSFAYDLLSRRLASALTGTGD
jgi:phosphatidylinositol alpha-1,6-mannosyltransferase